MAIEAPVSKYKKSNLKIYIVVCVVIAAWCMYDGYFNTKFINEHLSPEGRPQGWLAVNRHAPYYLLGAAIVLAVYFWAIKDRKLVADENAFCLSDDEVIKYDAIESIDKTNFAKKGYFVITYKDERGKAVTKELNDRNWDHLAPLLDHLVSKISA
jgi:hypothetical protein